MRKPDSIRRLSCDARTPSKEHSDSRTGIRVCVCVCVCLCHPQWKQGFMPRASAPQPGAAGLAPDEM